MSNTTLTARDFLAQRRSHPPLTLREPAPDRDVLMSILTSAARVPDHGKMEPWRFIVLTRSALDRLAPHLEQAALDAGREPEKALKERNSFSSPLIVAVVSSPIDSPKIPEWEQFLSAGAVCVSLVNAALARGFGAAWLTGTAASDPAFAQTHLGLKPTEKLVGLVHIGTPSLVPPERPRPDLSQKVTVLT